MKREVCLGSIRDLETIPLKQYEVAGTSILVSRVGSDYYATEAHCSHQKVSLEGGELEDRILTCPGHGAKFDVATGAVRSLPAIVPLATYPVRIENENIFITI